MTSEHLIFDNDQSLSPDLDLYTSGSVPARDISTLWMIVRAMQERGMVVLVRAMDDNDDGEGERLVFSTHPDTIRMEAASRDE